MSIFIKIKKIIFQKGKLASLKFSAEQIIASEAGEEGQARLYFSADDILQFSYSKNSSPTESEVLGLKTKKGLYVYRSNSMDADIYIKMLNFLGEKNLIKNKRNSMNPSFKIGIPFFILAIFSYNLNLGNLHIILSAGGIISVAGGIFSRNVANRQLEDFLKMRG